MSDAWGPPPQSSDPLREPRLRPGPHTGPWRLLTNFTHGALVRQAFAAWPDDVLPSAKLAEVYAGKADSPIGPFPFLDEREEDALRDFYAGHRGALLVPFAAYLRDSRTGMSSLWGGALPVFQSMLVLALRRAEVACGVWEKRSARQRSGAVFAVRQGQGTRFCRVSALPGRPDERVCMPWGGPYAEYAKILPLLEDRYTRLVFQSAGPDLEVVPEGHVIRKMQCAGLVSERNRGFLGSLWTLTAPAVGMTGVAGLLPGLRQVTQGICSRVAEVLPTIEDVMRSGKYSDPGALGDYVEMAYAVLFGLLCEWGMEECLLRKPPSFKVTEDGAFVERTLSQRVRGEYPDLPGIALLADARAIWDAIT